MHAPLRILAVLAFLSGIAFGPAPASATTIALVIAIDTSGSIDATEFDLQRQAYVVFSMTTRPAPRRQRAERRADRRRARCSTRGRSVRAPEPRRREPGARHFGRRRRARCAAGGLPVDVSAEWNAELVALGYDHVSLLESFQPRDRLPDSRIPLMIVANGFTAQELGDRIGQKLSLELNVPEPATPLVLACALGVFAIVRRRHRAR